ncbi:hypothetical protein [Desulfonatronospira sp.]|nr:hypothetical protein [Desulfonatronospira sp.]
MSMISPTHSAGCSLKNNQPSVQAKSGAQTKLITRLAVVNPRN